MKLAVINEIVLENLAMLSEGKHLICLWILVRGQKISAIAEISTERLIALNLKSSGLVNSDSFYDFINGSLIHQVHPFD